MSLSKTNRDAVIDHINEHWNSTSCRRCGTNQYEVYGPLYHLDEGVCPVLSTTNGDVHVHVEVVCCQCGLTEALDASFVEGLDPSQFENIEESSS